MTSAADRGDNSSDVEPDTKDWTRSTQAFVARNGFEAESAAQIGSGL